jgi:hypothetical protein
MGSFLLLWQNYKLIQEKVTSMQINLNLNRLTPFVLLVGKVSFGIVTTYRQ